MQVIPQFKDPRRYPSRIEVTGNHAASIVIDNPFTALVDSHTDEAVPPIPLSRSDARDRIWPSPHIRSEPVSGFPQCPLRLKRSGW
jgi:hypothetical protein